MSRTLLLLLAVSWVSLLAVGNYWLISYSMTPGQYDEAPQNWPRDSLLSKSDSKYSLLIGLHPLCPCSQATASELERLLPYVDEKLEVMVLLPSEDEKWLQAPLVQRFAAMPGARVVSDPDASESKRFTLNTSGECRLYDPSGRLRYSGGLTAARAHEGDNFGKKAVINIIKGLEPESCDGPSFGCPLLTEEDTPDEDEARAL